MSTSQNGWPAYDNGRHPELVAIPHVAGRVRRGDVAEIFVYVIGRFDREVEPVAEAAGQPEDDWGWASRPVRGKTTDLSNHASGTAIDLNAPQHPMGKRGTFTTGQVASIRGILAAVSPAVRWGGDYPGRADEMHFEINASAAVVAAVAARLRGGNTGSGAVAARPAPPTSEEDTMSAAGEARIIELLEGITIDARDSAREAQRLAGITVDARDAVREGRTRDKKLDGIVIDARDGVLGNRQILAELAGVKVALNALATGKGLDPKAITAAVDAGVTSALARVETTVTVKPEGGR